jgi:RimJ/RimL family protein N-acetyltransferase
VSDSRVISIRAAIVTDAAQLCVAEAETAKTPGLLRSRPDELHAESFAKRITELEAPGHRGRYIVALDNANAAIGHALLEPIALARSAHVFRLTIVVHPGHTDRGVGRAMMTDLLNWAARDSRVEKIELFVRATNARAIHLYQRFDFVEEGRLKRCIKLDDGTYIDDILMAWFPAK